MILTSNVCFYFKGHHVDKQKSPCVDYQRASSPSTKNNVLKTVFEGMFGPPIPECTLRYFLLVHYPVCSDAIISLTVFNTVSYTFSIEHFVTMYINHVNSFLLLNFYLNFHFVVSLIVSIWRICWVGNLDIWISFC